MSVTCDFKFEDVDFLLKRNWFVDMETLHELISELPEEVYYEVVEHRSNYHPDIRWALGEPAIPPHFIRAEVHDISDAEWQDMEEQKERQRRKANDERKKLFVPPPRPHSSIDVLIDNATAEIQKRRDALDNLIARSKNTHKYLGTSGRSKLIEDTPEIRAARERLTSSENEFAKVKELLDSSNKTWNDLAWCDAMLKDAAERRLFRTTAPAPRPSA
jgi:hypothetical protein